MKTKVNIHGFLEWVDEESPASSPLTKTFHALAKIIWVTIREFKKNELSLRSAALTYTVMLSLIPVLAMSTAVVKGLGGGNQLRQVVYGIVETMEHNSGQLDPSNADKETLADTSSLTAHLHDAVDRIFNYVDRTNFATLGTIGILGIVFSVILVFSNIEMAMNAIWNVENGRSIIRKVADYLALLILFPFSLNVGLAASTILKSESLQDKMDLILPMFWIQPLLLKLLPVFFLAVTIYVIYLFFPNTKVKTMPAVVGAIFAGFFWFEMQNIYITLQVGVSKYNAIYGSFATLPLFLIWIYLGWVFILTGAQLAFACQNHRHYRLTPLRAEPSMLLAAAFDLTEFTWQNFEQEKMVTLDDFKEAFPAYSSALADKTEDHLISRGILHHNEGRQTLSPSLPLSHLTDKKLIFAVLGKDFTDTPGGKKSKQTLTAAGSFINGTSSLTQKVEMESE